MNGPNGLVHRVGVDIGGTFTDLAWYDGVGGEIKFEKALSTPARLADGVERCISKAGIDLAQVLHLIHGSTVAVNAVIQKNGARTALVTTEGFTDVYEIGRANRSDTFNLFFRKPEPLVPATLRFGVRERMRADGTVMTPLSRESVRTMIRSVKKAGVDAVAVCLLHAYANPVHEIELGKILRASLPDLYVTLSHQILREYREYERTSTTVLNAYVGPEVNRYLGELKVPLDRAAFAGTFFIMQSNGGVMTVERARQVPVAMMESGPAGGIIGSASVGKLLGFDSVIAFDMGGTTAKACIVERGLPRMTDQYYVGGYREGYPMRLPVVDIIEVGAGGGSIAWVDEGGALKVGPRSAGSVPGPACYGRGGTEPTVTDGNLATGRLNPSYFLGGEISLDEAAATDAIARVVARPFDLGPLEAAQGILKIADARMSAAVRAITLQRGLDPRDFAMVAFGGAGPLHAVSIARELHIPRVIIPPQPGHFSALGMLLADLRHDFVQTKVVDLDGVGPAALESWFAPLEGEGGDALARQGCEPGSMIMLRSVDMRYVGQEYSVSVAVPAVVTMPGDIEELRARFDAAYELRYGHSHADIPAQIVALRHTAIGAVQKVDFSRLRDTAGKEKPRNKTRPVYFEGMREAVLCPVHQRSDLPIGQYLDGPAIIEEYASTTVVHPGDRATIEPHGCLLIEIGTA